jgi:predicted deacetylase
VPNDTIGGRMTGGEARAPVLVSIHHVAPATELACSELIAMVEMHAMSAAVLVVPGPWRGHELHPGSEFAERLVAMVDRGHGVVLHGWTHTAERIGLGWLNPRRLPGHLLTRGCAEFHGSTAAEARRRLEWGIDRLHRAGTPPLGFVAPGWMLDTALHPVVRRLGLRHIASRTHLFDLVSGRRWHIPTATNRPDSSLQGVGRLRFESLLTRRLRHGRAVGIALHPADIQQPDLRDSIDRMLTLAAHRGRSVTPTEFLSNPITAHIASPGDST